MIAVKLRGLVADAFRSQTDWPTKNNGRTTAVAVTTDTVTATRNMTLRNADVAIVTSTISAKVVTRAMPTTDFPAG